MMTTWPHEGWAPGTLLLPAKVCPANALQMFYQGDEHANA